MSARKMPSSPASASKGFSSTPLKYSSGKDLHRDRSVDDECVLSDDEDDTFSLLSPIYHDSFDSDEDLDAAAQQLPRSETSPSQSDEARLSISPVRCELPKTQLVPAAVELAASPTLSAWEMWLVNKAKDDRLKLEKKAEEERLLKEKKEQQERVQQQKKIIMDEKIQDWLKMKREQEKQQQLVKQSKEQQEIQRQQVKQRETEQKAQEKYKEWMRKKNQEKMEKERKEKEAAVRREEQEKERRKRAEEKFKEWLTHANEKSRDNLKSHCYPRSPYDKAYPSPSFCNPIPWKPIHVPPAETPQKNTSRRKPQKQMKCQQSPSVAFRLRNTVSAAQLQQRR